MPQVVERKASDTSRSRERVGGMGHQLGTLLNGEECCHVKSDAQDTLAGIGRLAGVAAS